jgi:hypothetical protein
MKTKLGLSRLLSPYRIFGIPGTSVGIDNLFDQRVDDPAADFAAQHNLERSEREIWGRLEWRLGL